MEVKQKINIHNRFDVEVRDVDGNLKQEATGYNIVLDSMYNRLCGGNSYFDYIHFGTGTGTPVASGTSLFTHLGTKIGVNEEQVKAIPNSSWKQKIVLAPEEYVGDTITEVGIAYGSSSSYLVTHAMLKDSEGNPISITKTSTDVITIYATIFVTFDTSIPELTYTGMPNGNELVNYLIGGSSAPTGSFGLNECVAPYVRLGSTSYASWTSDVANKKRKTDVKRFDINTGNGNVLAIDFGDMFALELPATGIFSGQPYVDVPIGTGDGAETVFEIPSYNIQSGMLDIKIDGIATTAFTSLIETGGATDLIRPPNMPGYGYSVSLSSDRTVLAVGTYNDSPYVKVYDWDNGWTERPAPPNMPSYGDSVSLSSDGTVLAVGTYDRSPYVKIYDWDNGWTERATPPNMPSYGKAVSLSSDGTVLAVGTIHISPHVKVYDWNAGWTERATPPNMPGYGDSVSLSSDGTVLAVGTYYKSPYVKIYDWDNGWTERPAPPNMPSYVYSVSLSSDGTVLAVGTHDRSPYVKIYDWDNGWTERATPPNMPGYGDSVSLSSDGTVLAVGTYNDSPYVKIYDWDNGWTERATPPNMPSYGKAVSLSSDGTVLAVGTYHRSPYVKVYDYTIQEKTTIDFTTPPAIGEAITADYTVKGIHKTDQYVVDISFAIQFGEGV